MRSNGHSSTSHHASVTQVYVLLPWAALSHTAAGPGRAGRISAPPPLRLNLGPMARRSRWGQAERVRLRLPVSRKTQRRPASGCCTASCPGIRARGESRSLTWLNTCARKHLHHRQPSGHTAPAFGRDPRHLGWFFFPLVHCRPNPDPFLGQNLTVDLSP